MPPIANAVDDRGDPHGPEIYLMLGLPEHILEERRREITNAYFKLCHDFKVHTGNPLPGSDEAKAMSKRQKINNEDTRTKEEKKAHIEAHRAMNRAKKEALKNGTAINNEEGVSGPPQQHITADSDASFMMPQGSEFQPQQEIAQVSPV